MPFLVVCSFEALPNVVPKKDFTIIFRTKNYFHLLLSLSIKIPFCSKAMSTKVTIISSMLEFTELHKNIFFRLANFKTIILPDKYDWGHEEAYHPQEENVSYSQNSCNQN